MLLIHEVFAYEQAQMPRPQEIWHVIVKDNDSSPGEADVLLDDLWMGAPDQIPFAEWWKHNEEHLRQLAVNGKSADREERPI